MAILPIIHLESWGMNKQIISPPPDTFWFINLHIALTLPRSVLCKRSCSQWGEYTGTHLVNEWRRGRSRNIQGWLITEWKVPCRDDRYQAAVWASPLVLIRIHRDWKRTRCSMDIPFVCIQSILFVCYKSLCICMCVCVCVPVCWCLVSSSFTAHLVFLKLGLSLNLEVLI